ncbi:hypothetical protein ACHAWT_000128 [Skeletonema menzelii]
MNNAASNSPRHQPIQHQGRPSDPFIVFSPLVCRIDSSIKIKLNNVHENEKENTTSTSYLAGIDDVTKLGVHQIIDDFETGAIDFMSSNMVMSGKQVLEEAPPVHAPYPIQGHRLNEGRAGIRTRNRFQPSQNYEKIWEDNDPPSAAAKARHSAVKSRSSRSNEQISLDKSLHNSSAHGTGKGVKVTKRKAVCLSSKPTPLIATKHLSSRSKSNSKRNTQVDTSITPTEVDVLFGRGGRAVTHNTKFREEVKKFADRYRRVGRDDKAIVSTEVINAVKGYGGRFLAFDDGSWHEVDDSRAMLKVSQALRDRK